MVSAFNICVLVMLCNKDIFHFTWLLLDLDVNNHITVHKVFFCYSCWGHGVVTYSAKHRLNIYSSSLHNALFRTKCPLSSGILHFKHSLIILGLSNHIYPFRYRGAGNWIVFWLAHFDIWKVLPGRDMIGSKGLFMNYFKAILNKGAPSFNHNMTQVFLENVSFIPMLVTGLVWRDQ